MNARKYFDYQLSMNNGARVMITPKVENLPFKKTEGSLNVLAARVMEISYADFLRLCRDEFGAQITGKGHKYPVAYFELNEPFYAFLKLLNTRMDFILKREALRKKQEQEENNVSE